MKKIVLLMFFIAFSLHAAAAKQHLYEDFFLFQKKSETNLKEFKQIDPYKYNLEGDVWAKDLGFDKKLILKFNKDELIFLTLVEELYDFNDDTMLKAPKSANRVILLKGAIKENSAIEEDIYSLASTDIPLKEFETDLEDILFKVNNDHGTQNYLFRTSFVEQIDEKNYRAISRIASCKFYEKEGCEQCQFIEGVHKKTSCTLFEVYHKVK